MKTNACQLSKNVWRNAFVVYRLVITVIILAFFEMLPSLHEASARYYTEGLSLSRRIRNPFVPRILAYTPGTIVVYYVCTTPSFLRRLTKTFNVNTSHWQDGALHNKVEPRRQLPPSYTRSASCGRYVLFQARICR